MAQQTINIGASPNDGTGTPLRTAFQYTNSNFSELYTAVGPSGNNIVVPGNATITGDLTVDTSTLKVNSSSNTVAVGTASSILNGVLSVAQQVASGVGSTTLTLDHYNANNKFIQFGWYGASIGSIGQNSGTFLEIDSPIIGFKISGTEAMRLNATGLGVGASPRSKLDVNGGLLVNNYVTSTNYAPLSVTTASAITTPSTFTNAISIYNPTNVGAYSNITFGYNALGITNAGAYIGYVSTSSAGFGKGDLVFGTRDVTTDTAATERFRIDASGNCGIGVTPSAWGAGYTALQNRQTSWFSTSARDLNLGANVYVDGVGYKYIATAAASNYVQYQGAHSWYNAPSGTAGNAITFTQAMTLDASGNLLVGVTAAPSGTIGGSGFIADSNSRKQLHLATTASASQVLAVFINPNGTVGTIETNGSSTAYNISSDYRLKEEVKPLTGALNRITALKPSTYKWKVDGSVGEGFIAHELAEVVPFAVSGQKDAVNADGSMKTQGVDLSKIIPILVAAVQELTARVQTLETR